MDQTERTPRRRFGARRYRGRTTLNRGLEGPSSPNRGRMFHQVEYSRSQAQADSGIRPYPRNQVNDFEVIREYNFPSSEDNASEVNSNTTKSDRRVFQPRYQQIRRGKASYSPRGEVNENDAEYSFGISRTPENLLAALESYDKELYETTIHKSIKKIRDVYTKFQRASKRRNCPGNYADVLKRRMENLDLQMKQFNSFLAEIANLISYNCEENFIRSTIQLENDLFKLNIPSYGVANEILKALEINQVVIVQADYSYSFNNILPIFIQKKFRNHYLISCETNETLRLDLQKNISSRFSQFRNVDITKTEEMLLKELANWKKSFEKPLFIILNLPLERSLEADLMLAKLREILSQCVHSRIVLLVSNQDNAFKLENYFSKACLLEMPELIFPVTVKLRHRALPPVENYITEAVGKIIAIHNLKIKGDILAFFPSLSNAITASNNVHSKLKEKVKCDVLMDTNQISHTENKMGRQERNVFFASDGAEMLFNPTVQHVIDCGVRKVYVYDPINNLDVETLTYISNARAEIRKSLAGVTDSGVYYPLYDVENLEKEEYPQVLRSDPLNTMLKIYNMWPQKALSIEFMESFSDDLKNDAIKLLQKHEILKRGKLTEFGKKVAQLPYSFKHSKLIMFGFKWGLKFEAVVIVAFFLAKGRVFQYSTDEKVQNTINAIKVKFLRNDSDVLSYLYIYKEWVENNYSDSWCEDNFINLETMKSVHENVNEICENIDKHMEQKIEQQICDMDLYISDILQMLLECFQANLCVSTGHYRSGYRILSSGSIGFIHRSSMVHDTQNLPEILIFHHMLSTSRDFLFDVTAVPRKIVEQCVAKGKLDIQLSDLRKETLVPERIEPVSERIIRQFLLGKRGQKLKQIEQNINEQLNDTCIIIDPSAEKGFVDIYALRHQILNAKNLLIGMIREHSQYSLSREELSILELRGEHSKIPVEIKWASGGIVTSIKVDHHLNVEDNSYIRFTANSPISVHHSIHLTWNRRDCNGTAFVTFSNDKDFREGKRELEERFISLLGCQVKVGISKNRKQSLYITGLPPSARIRDLENDLNSLLPGIKLEIRLIYTPEFETTERMLQDLKDKVEDLCDECTDLASFNIIIPPPKPSSIDMKAFINVNEDENLEEAARRLSGQTVGNSEISSLIVCQSKIKIKMEIYNALKSAFNDCFLKLKRNKMQEFPDPFTFEFIDDQNRSFKILKLLTHYKTIMEELKFIVNEQLEGQVLRSKDSKELSKLFCYGGHVFLKNLQKEILGNEDENDLCIIEDAKRNVIRLYGSIWKRKKAKERIIKFLEDSENENVKIIRLSDGSSRRVLLKAVIMEYGVNLENFIEACGLRSAILNLKSCEMEVYGSPESTARVSNPAGPKVLSKS
ncbi:pre-mRNA-splicing factor ATP-dependent RNA helicase PRP22-like isoform X2 [Stegodyphus dumicola]|uniref:pre-mRNA-splicing factor ATP-dependent RNA helicase PRP22-like isoform X2 n=1 Tax=Stegodyphus dumicola TaxID=202533 RepID=UPI0015AA6A5E|nr:pre-mRNA-splicing factor ATP-dependent RNA helicase PRP22-like isoform X2 [Stegodyphus dumicola]